MRKVDLHIGEDSPDHRYARSPSLQLRWKEGIEKANQFVKLKSNMEQRRATASAVYNNYLFVFGGSTRFKAFRSSTLQTTQVANVAPFLSNSASK
ncbi:hypothetical protein AB6735_08525 [Mucilaginibacter sp. RCC_168]|uniref:hypothetical protein n=1 Tax=Mucilaginibacter sp. RCC_168 TaxID=3239221 RepID=UPI003523C9F9